MEYSIKYSTIAEQSLNNIFDYIDNIFNTFIAFFQPFLIKKVAFFQLFFAVYIAFFNTFNTTY